MFSASPTRTNYGWSTSALTPTEARAITRRESHHQRVGKKVPHMSTRQKFTEDHRRSKFQPPSAAASACCLLSVLPPATVPLSSHALASLFDASSCIQPFSASIPENLHNATNNLHGSVLMIADLDPATAKLAIGFAGPFLSGFGFLFILRIVMSWYPKLPVGKFPYVLAYAPTEPFLKITRKVIPPLGGVDVTPVVWFGLVSFLNEILVGPQGLLVLLSQQI